MHESPSAQSRTSCSLQECSCPRPTHAELILYTSRTRTDHKPLSASPAPTSSNHAHNKQVFNEGIIHECHRHPPLFWKVPFTASEGQPRRRQHLIQLDPVRSKATTRRPTKLLLQPGLPVGDCTTASAFKFTMASNPVAELRLITCRGIDRPI